MAKNNRYDDEIQSLKDAIWNLETRVIEIEDFVTKLKQFFHVENQPMKD
jgi:hypothetical protein